MAQPRKRRGFKSLAVDDRSYSWRLNDSSGFVEVSLADAYTQRLEIDFGWYDKRSYQPGKNPADSEADIVTPRFIEAAIRFALKEGWNPDALLAAMSIKFDKGVFTLAEV